MSEGLIKTFQLNAKVPSSHFDIIASVVSRDEYWSELSPFYLGPCKTTNGEWFHNMENLWQYSKVYPQLGHLDSSNQLTDDWFDWFDEGRHRKRADRHPAGRNIPSFSYWNGHYLSYIAARKLIYIPQYVKLAVKTERYKELKKAYRDGARIAIKDYDCYSMVSPKPDTWDKVINSEKHIMGHGFVLAMMLELGPRFFKTLVI